MTGSIDLTQFFPTGTSMAVTGSTLMTDSSLYDNRFYTSRLGVGVTQSLLRGFGSDVNLADLRQARLDTRLSEYELRGFSESLVAQVEQTYWAFALARRQIEIVEESLKIARQQLDETRELIAVGRLAETELAAVQAEVAAQEQGLINARSELDKTQLGLLRLLNPPGGDLWQREISLIHQPRLPEIAMDDVGVYVRVARRMRPLLNEARLRVMRGDLQLVKTRNGLLPMMDLFVTLGKSGYSDSFGDSVSDLTGSNYDALVGLRFEYPFFNREAEGVNRRALLSRDQAAGALVNLEQLVELDVRTAYIEVNRAKQQIAASSATRRFDAEKFRTESEKFRVGKSTNFLVAQAQRDLLVSRIAEVRAVANYLTALVDLYLKDGTLLERHGIAAPGREPVGLRGDKNS
jgi:outer membrane protein TolC